MDEGEAVKIETPKVRVCPECKRPSGTLECWCGYSFRKDVTIEVLQGALNRLVNQTSGPGSLSYDQAMKYARKVLKNVTRHG